MLINGNSSSTPEKTVNVTDFEKTNVVSLFDSAENHDSDASNVDTLQDLSRNSLEMDPSFSAPESDENSDESPSEKVNKSQCVGECESVLKDTLCNWIENEKQVPHASVDRLLTSLNLHFNLPKSTKTLKKSKDWSISSMDNGDFLHLYSWVSDMQIIVKDHDLSDVNLIVNIDGIPLNNPLGVSKYHAYPILVNILEINKIVCAGIFCTNSFEDATLPDPEIFLKTFIDEINTLNDCQSDSSNSSSLSGFSNHINFHVIGFCCDAPMRAYLKNIILHSGYNSCERCVVHGDFVNNTVCLLQSQCELRSDQSFALRNDPNHHKKSNKRGILESINFPMVSGFILDTMHLCYLGVIKRLLSRLVGTKAAHKKVRIGRNEKELFHQKLLTIQSHIPSEFNRKLEGGIHHILRWKASQYRLFALYIGIIMFAFKNIVSRKINNNFLKLSIALRLLNSPDQYENISFITYLLNEFVEDSKNIYGSSFVCYNVHCLIHLPQDYVKFGNLGVISAFCFENYLGSHVKGAVRAGYKPLSQIASHISNLNKKSIDKEKLPAYSFSKKISNCNHGINGQCFKKIHVASITFKVESLGQNDCYVMLPSGEIGKIISIHKENESILLQLAIYKVSNLFVSPIQSVDVGIFKLGYESPMTVHKINNVSVIEKMFVVPFRKNHKIAIKML